MAPGKTRPCEPCGFQLSVHTGEAKKIVCSALPSLSRCGRASVNWPPLPNHNCLKTLTPYSASLSRRPHLGPEDGDGEEGGTAVLNAHVHGLAPLLHLQDEVCGLAETKARGGGIRSTWCSQPQARLPPIPPRSSPFFTHPLCSPVCAAFFFSLFLVLLIFVFVLLWIPSQV